MCNKEATGTQEYSIFSIIKNSLIPLHKEEVDTLTADADTWEKERQRAKDEGDKEYEEFARITHAYLVTKIDTEENFLDILKDYLHEFDKEKK